MDISLLYTTCQQVRLTAWNDFKNKITNAIFPLTNNIIDIEINDMLSVIRQKVRAVIYNKYNVSLEQEMYIKKTIKNHTDFAMKRGHEFEEMQRNKQAKCM